MNFIYRKNQEGTIVMAIYGNLSFGVINTPNGPSNGLVLGVVEDLEALNKTTTDCNRHTFERNLDEVLSDENDHTKLKAMYKNLTKVVTKQLLKAQTKEG